MVPRHLLPAIYAWDTWNVPPLISISVAKILFTDTGYIARSNQEQAAKRPRAKQEQASAAQPHIVASSKPALCSVDGVSDPELSTGEKEGNGGVGYGIVDAVGG